MQQAACLLACFVATSRSVSRICKEFCTCSGHPCFHLQQGNAPHMQRRTQLIHVISCWEREGVSAEHAAHCGCSGNACWFPNQQQGKLNEHHLFLPFIALIKEVWQELSGRIPALVSLASKRIASGRTEKGALPGILVLQSRNLSDSCYVLIRDAFRLLYNQISAWKVKVWITCFLSPLRGTDAVEIHHRFFSFLAWFRNSSSILLLLGTGQCAGMHIHIYQPLAQKENLGAII